MRLSKAKFEKFKNFLTYEHPMCQICAKAPSVEPHHVKFGRYGADKDDRKIIAVCRACHQWCHAHKHESIEKYERLADENWKEFNSAI